MNTLTQTEKGAGTSDRYSFIPTSRVLGVLADHGWTLESLKEAPVRIKEKEGYQRHMLKLRNPSFEASLGAVGAKPEITLINAHDGTAAFRLYAGMAELVCLNRLLANGDKAEMFRIPHIGYTDQKVEVATAEIVRFLPEVFAKRERFQGLTLDREEQLAFAKAATQLKFDGEKYAVEPSDLIRPHRSAQAAPTLWNTFQNVQEHIIRGGVRQRRADGSRIRSRAVNSILEDVRLNRELWKLTEETALLLN